MIIFRLTLLIAVTAVLVCGGFDYRGDITALQKEVSQDSVELPLYQKDILEKLQLQNLLKYDVDDDDNNFCLICKTFANFLIELVRSGATRDQLINVVSDSCLNLGVSTARVCRGTTELNVDIFVDIVEKHPELTGKNLCGIRYKTNDCELSNNTLVDWTVDIPKGSSKNRPKPLIPKEGLKILHISDIHYDTLYTPNKTNACGEPICCQADQGNGNISSGTACGFWGDYEGADSPSWVLPEVLKDIKNCEFDYVYFTGDMVSHRTWATSVSFNSKVLRSVYNEFKKTFNVPVYPVVGNHEPTPANIYYFADDADSRNFSTTWLYELAIEEWGNWLPQETFETILKGGFYTVSPRDGLRVVVLNNNIAHNANWWLVDSTYDPYEQLAWLVQVLDRAERNNESVHMLSHFPSGEGLLKVWSKEYNKIIKRYQNTVTAQFNGHTHFDQFVVYYEKDDDFNQTDYVNNGKADFNYSTKSTKYEPINVAFNGASITTLNSVNPSYKIYSVENSTYDILDFDEYTFNLTQANMKNFSAETPLKWYKLYSFTEAYNVSSLVPKELDSLLYRMCDDHSLLDQYHRFRFRNADPALKKGCDDDCKKDYLCEMSKSQMGKKNQCEIFQKLYDESSKYNF